MNGVGELNHVAINVRNLERATQFYEQGLGLRKTLQKPVGKETWRFLRLPPGTTGDSVFLQGPTRVGQIELVQWKMPPGHEHATRAGDFGISVLSFPVAREHIREVHKRLKALGAECYSEPEENLVQNYGIITLFICEDPDGNQIEIVSLPTIEEVRAYRASLKQANASASLDSDLGPAGATKITVSS